MTLLLHVVMLFLLSGGSAEVVQNFELKCGQFFAGGKSPTTFTGSQQICQTLHGDDYYATYCDAGGKSPTRFSGSQYKQICQNLNNRYYYATYYDTKNRIPVYSAYKFEGRLSCERPNNWYIEPQLDTDNASPNMCFENQNIQGLGEHQALNRNYDNSRYHRGHLVPVYHRNSRECVEATFTLTNAAPQNSSFNCGQWRVLEKNISNNLTGQCLEMYSVFIVTGVVPGPTKISDNKVNVPSHFWTAFCCLDQNNKCKFSRGFIGVNDNKNITPLNITVNALNERLAELYEVESFKVFDSSTEP
ncbi:endonuclease domain-containing 1 protein-like [Megalobrama amblycephala]|uniref:endonuclease domain-containing 1 protein-like n=1 Tax=Megalobrama amblycephala TaxID=75352 RepID=UPI00201424F2|nr:endonuclease domain-containing 1 protein-like [Megalobrama amblycephala]